MKTCGARVLLLLVLLLLAACSLTVNDTPELRSAIEAKYGATVAAPGELPGVLKITLLTPPPLPTIEPVVLPTVTPEPTQCDPVIKGNINAQGRKLYHTPDSPQYAQTVIDEAKGERMFCTEQEALDAGWTKAGGP